MNRASDIQGLVDALAAELDRPVGLDDHRFRSLAYSSHHDQVDQVRMFSILQREAPPEVIAWLESLGVRDLERFGRVAANERLGMSARVCVPVRFGDLLLGFLWLIDQPQGLTAEQLEEAARYAEEIAVALYRDRVLEQDSRERERELLAQVLGKTEGNVAAAAAELIDGGYLAPAPSYIVLLLRAAGRSGQQVPDPVRVRLADSTEQLRRTMAPHHTLILAGGEEVVAVLAPGSAMEADRRAETLAAAAAQALSEYPEWEVRVGVGEEGARVDGLAASYRQAGLAVRVAAALSWRQRVARWSELGAYRTVAALVDEGDGAAHVPESLRRLLANDDGATLVATLERYLDLGGDARAAAEALYIHRSSLYGRLHRIEEIAGVDLHSGEDRLELHLGIRILRLEGGLGEHPTTVESEAPSSRRKSDPTA